MLIRPHQGQCKDTCLGMKANHTTSLFTVTEYHQGYPTSPTVAVGIETNKRNLPSACTLPFIISTVQAGPA